MSGSLRERAPGVWEIRVALGRDPLTGNYRQVSRTVHGGKRKAHEEMARIVASAAEGRHKGTKATVGFLLDRWLKHLETLGRSPKTLEGYRSLIRTAIRPALGKIELAKLTAADLDGFYARLRKRGLADNTIHHYHACVSAALRQAMRWGWIDHPPSQRATPPPLRGREVKPPSVEDLRRVLVHLERRNPDFAALVYVAATTGCRRGELCALRWSDLDLEAATLTVSRAITETRSDGLIEKDLKTHRARRLALDDSTVAVLRAHRAHLERRWHLVGAAPSEEAFVWSSEVDSSAPLRPDQVSGTWRRVANKLELGPVRFHDLRHFAATVLVGAGVDIRTIAGRLGHAHPAITFRTYAHFVEAADRQAAAVMGSLALIDPGVPDERALPPVSEPA
ncbi:MAG TPA: site-specific integrase [Acidimicrobiales bacterium]|nr:site-specific integrase [Acidimicrobiales bacterium]